MFDEWRFAVLLELVSIATEAEPLDGIFYTPKNGKISAAALLFHGNCHNFYTGPSRFLPSVLASLGIASLAFNRRGHDMVTSLQGRTVGGGSYQLAREGIATTDRRPTGSRREASRIPSSLVTATAACSPHSIARTITAARGRWF
jgi:hypothetical protein